MLRSVRIWPLAAMAGLAMVAAFAQQPRDQVADPEFDPKVAAPAYTSRQPAVLFDEAHHNLHTTGGLYKPFADLIGHDGYRVEPNKQPITRAALDRYRILVIANAAGDEGEGPKAASPAFTEAECRAIDAWVKAGGALLLITDINHWGAASRRLGVRFGIEMSQGVTVDPRNSVPGMPARLVFSREDGLIGDHPITRGRDASERVNRVVTYAGQSLLGPRGSVPFLILGETAVDQYPGDLVAVRAAGRCQGLAMTHGKGRVVVLGEAGALSAQFGRGGRPFGMNDPGNDNRQLALNIMHWLSGLIPADPGAAAGRTDPPAPRPGP